MNEQEFRQELKKGLSGTYFFFGEEEYLKKFYSSRAQILTVGDDGDLSGWNSYSIEGKKQKKDAADFTPLEEAVNAVPMMGDRVFIKYTVDFSVLTEDETKRLCSLVESVDEEQTVLVIIAPEDGFDAGTLPKKPSALYKKLSEICKMVNFCKMTPAELKKWMARRVGKDSMTMDPQAADALLKRSGSTMFALSGELDKLVAYTAANGKNIIDTEAVSLVCSANEEETAFAMANALMNGDRRAALRELHRCKTSREEPVVVLGMIAKSLSDMLTVCCLMEEGEDQKGIASKMKMHEYRAGLMMNSVKNIKPEQLIATLGRCREADLSMKTGVTGGYVALERFICTIPTGRRR